MSINPETLKQTAKKETALFLCLLLTGLLILPLAVYLVGNSVFGDYGGAGFSAFYGALHSAIRAGDPVVLFLVLAPYVIWQLSRFTTWAFRQSLRRRQQAGS